MKKNQIAIITDTPVESEILILESLSTDVMMVSAEDIHNDAIHTRGIASVTLIMIPSSIIDMPEIYDSCKKWIESYHDKSIEVEVRYY